ncbi:baculoviral IAP repeat-containing protein 7-like [Mytilus galloprovincialis]|uniref:baculoviral IAP repeat-containing protein 7-like n=1 Tax=Mytilus galloprovincialis TaxID=29158 RepID=UPI003F7C89E5
MSSKLDPFLEEKIKNTNLRDDMKYELLRIKSFVDRPNTEKGFAIRFAAAGFFYTGTGNKVKCFACLREKEDWKDWDQPFKLHRDLNPYCGFLTKTDRTNIPAGSESVELRDRFDPITHLFDSLPPEIPTEVVGPSKQNSSSKLSDMNGPHENNIDPSDPNMNRPDNFGPNPERNIAVQSTSEDAQFNRQQTETFSLSLGPGSGPSSRENLAAVAARSASIGATKTEYKPQNMQKVDAGNLKYERHRLETFRTWPMGTPVTAKELAKNGFYYTGTGDRVQCVFCKGILKDWEVGDKPHIEHKNRFPRCPYVLGTNVGNVAMPPPNPSSTNQPPNVGFLNNQPMSNMEALGINTERPKNPQYAVESSRISTFRNWPTYKHQTPETLGSAGFFFAGFGDNVKCFYCDGGLRNWEAGDDPWVEHARWFPKCPFVLSVKGQEYIKNVQAAFQQGGQRQQTRVAGGHQIEDREIKARMELPLVRTVLSTGVSKSSVMKAIEKRLRDTGDDFADAEALLEAVLTMEAQPEDIGITTPTQGTNTAGPSSLPTPSSTAGPSGSQAGPSSIGSEKGPASNSSSTGHQQNDMITCKICLENEVGIVFLPCGHLCCCVQCAPAVQQCPVCRAQIRGNVRTYIT